LALNIVLLAIKQQGTGEAIKLNTCILRSPYKKRWWFEKFCFAPINYNRH